MADTPAQAALREAFNSRLPTSGGTMTGELILNGDPSTNLAAATKQYVDSGLSNISWNSLSGKPNFATVAITGNYNDLVNKPNIPANPKAYVTQTWRSGAQWYRRWSDGWLEQGGRIKLRVWTGGASPNSTFSLPTHFSNTTYTTVVTGENGYGWGGLKTVSQTTNSVTVTGTGASRDDYVDYVHFYCSGY